MVRQVQTISQFQTLVIVIVIVSGIMSVPVSCGRIRQRRNQPRNLTDTQCLHRLRHQYLFVVNVLHPSNNGGIVPDVKKGSSFCPWTWSTDEDVNRIPRYLPKAECPRCRFECRQVLYSHNSLVQQCTQTSRGSICTWARMERTLPVAYVYVKP